VALHDEGAAAEPLRCLHSAQPSSPRIYNSIAWYPLRNAEAQLRTNQ
jgi:hypothetical protein